MANNKNNQNQEGRSQQSQNTQNQEGRSQQSSQSNQNQAGRSQQQSQGKTGMSREEAGHLGGSAPHTCRGFQCQEDHKGNK